MNQQNKQEARVALVTGGSRRIGAAIVKTLHAAGFRVVIHCHHSLKEAHQLAMHLNEHRMDSALVVQRDLTAPFATDDLIKTTVEWGGRLDVLVNNASVFIRTKADSLEQEDWDLLFNTNVKAPFSLSLLARNFLVQHKGAIINITDIHSQTPLKGYSAYCQSKAALEMQTRSLAYEFAPEIRVNAVAPGAIAWPEHANSLGKDEQEKIIGKTLLKCHGNPEYIAQMVLALIENPFITGQIVKVDGGRK